MTWLRLIAGCLWALCCALSFWQQHRYYERGDIPRATYCLVGAIGFGLLAWWDFP